MEYTLKNLLYLKVILVYNISRVCAFSILAKGKVIVGVENIEKEYTAPACIEIKAGLNHSVTALEDSVWFCIHATNEKDPEKVDQLVIMKE